MKPSLQSRAPRRGQALILAVLVMLFAVLLSTAFLVVVGNTGRQIGNETDRSEASRNAEKGVAFVVAQLRTAPNPDTYSPAQFAGVLPTNTSERELYYSQLDKAMGWEAQNYVKFPNPLTSRQAPQFLVRSDLVTDDAEGGDKRFMLKITVIGLSSKNPESWSRRTLYKTTNWNGATFSYANFVTAFDPDSQKPIVSALAQTPIIGTLPNSIDVDVYSSKGQGNERVTYSPRIAEVGNTLMISDGKMDPLVGVVSSAQPSTVTNVSGYRLNLRVLKGLPGATSFTQNAKVALVGSLFELPTNIDENGDTNGVPATAEGPTQEQRIVGVSGATDPSLAPFGNGAQFNNGLNVPLTTTFVGRPPVAPGMMSSTVAGQNFLASNGPISIGDPAPTPTGTPLAIQFANGANAMQPVTLIPQTNANQNQFFRVGYDQAGAPQLDTASSLVAPVIAPRAVPPAPIDFSSYANKAKGGTVAGNNGYGPGVYLANTDDREKIGATELSTSQLQRFWQRKSFPATTGGNFTMLSGGAGAKLCYGRPGTDAYLYPMPSGSLEQRAIRGWISPWEFLPRGAQVTLDGATNTITITRDALDDSGSVSQGWKIPDGSTPTSKCTQMSLQVILETTGIYSGTYTANYSMGTAGVVLATQVVHGFNGIICAEGNVRVRGTWTGVPLTIVSGNNIYIEGNVSARDAMNNLLPGKIALLAKKNVVLNPTQFVARPAGTVDTSVGKSAFPGSVSGGTGMVTLTNISDTNSFKLGDKVAVFAPNTPANGWHTVTAINGAVLAFADATIPDAAAVKVKLACDPPIVLLRDKPDSTSDFFEGHTASPDANDPHTEELNPTTNAASAGTAWAYKFGVGGDTLARTVPFAGTVAVAVNQAAEKKNLTFTVRGGDDPGAMPPIVDTGARRLTARSASDPFQLLLTPPSGTATDPVGPPQTFDLRKVDGSVEGDANSTLKTLRDELVKPPFDSETDTKSNRWRLDLPVGLQDILAARRLTRTDIVLPADATRASNDETTIPRLRVPLTSSVLLFNDTDLNVGTPTTKALYTIGSIFDYQPGPLPTPTTPPSPLEEDPTTIVPTFYGVAPKWSIDPGTTGPPATNTVTYKKVGVSGLFAWTRDGAGDYNNQLPAYYLSAMRFQRVNGMASVAPAPPDTARPDRNVKTNLSVEVDATIYAEGGSWFVIPTPGTTTYDATRGLDQNIEWRRPAYAVTINGNIAQMMTPTATVDYDDEPDADGVVTGAMKRWTDSLSYQVLAADGTTKWQTIRYQAAPLPVLVQDPAFPMDPTKLIPASLPQLPASSDILYTYSN